ncbi:MAG: tetratricopeptide repeat protein [Acidobacteriota bacterium]
MTDRDEKSDPEEGFTEATKREGQAPSSKSVRSKLEAAPAQLARGTLVGRYVVLDKLGEGGMGVVYGAFDPELDRKVAIKVLQGKDAGGSSGGDQAWLLREAQALARLAHPNVVAVHDVGSLPGDQVFVAMELVEGETMRAWLKAKERTWREVVPVMLAAGAGLAAAHEVGLVHRDFKPENVLVGKDGRVRVMDFGLARLRTDDADPPPRRRSDLQVDAKSPLSAELTLAGHVVGTPAYMAPEIYDEHPADARTDQFGFGVTLFEALFHRRPYDKKDLLPSRSAPPRPDLPGKTRVPAHLAKIALRAIAIDPAQRFGSMRELLAALAVDPYRRRKHVAIACAAAGTLALFGLGGYSLLRQRSELCSGAGARLAGVWDAQVKGAVHAAFAKTKKAFAETSFAGLARALDAYTGDWTQAVTESCKATRVRGEQTEEVLSLRSACLDSRLEEVRALSKLLADADAGIVEKGDKIAFGLDPIADCANVAVLRAPGLPPPDIKAKVIELDRTLAEAKAQLIAGNYLPALTKAKGTVDGALALHWEPIAAEAYQIRGAALLAVGNMQEAVQGFQDATWAAMRGKRDDVVAFNALSVASIISDGLGKPDQAQVWVDLGVAAAARVGPSPGLEARRYEVASMVAAEKGDLNTAVALYDKAFAAAVEAFGGKDVPALSSIESDFGTTLSRAGAYGKALPHYEHALALRVQSVGEEHPDSALIMSNLGLCYRHTGQPQKARAMFEKALAIREKLFGKRHPYLLATLDNFAELLEQEGDHAGALAMIERALAIAKLVPGTAHPMYHQIATDYAEILVGAGRHDDARALYDQVFELEQKAGSNVLPATQAARANLALVEDNWADAERYAEQSIAGYEAQGGKDQPSLWRPLTLLAKAKLGTHDVAAARTLLERALAIGAKANVADDDLQPTRDALAHLPQ